MSHEYACIYSSHCAVCAVGVKKREKIPFNNRVWDTGAYFDPKSLVPWE